MRIRGLIWGLVAVGSLVTLFCIYRWMQPFAPRDWSVTRAEAVEIALESFSAFGDAVPDPYIVARLDEEFLIEQQLYERRAVVTVDELVDSPLADQVIAWEVLMYNRDALPRQWTYRAEISPGGDLLALRLQVPEDEDVGATVSDSAAIAQANDFLEARGFDLNRYDEPVLRRRDLEARTDLSLRYRDRRAVLGDAVTYGLAVEFAGDRLAGFQPWMEDPDREARLIAVSTTERPAPRSASGSETEIWFMFPAEKTRSVSSSVICAAGIVSIGTAAGVTARTRCPTGARCS